MFSERGQALLKGYIPKLYDILENRERIQNPWLSGVVYKERESADKGNEGTLRRDLDCSGGYTH